MWNTRLGSWHLAARPAKLSPALSSHFQALLGMPLNYSELFWSCAFSLDRTWKGTSKGTAFCSPPSLEQTFIHAHVFSPDPRGEVAQRLGHWPSGLEVGPRVGLSAREKGGGRQIITKNTGELKTRWVRGNCSTSHGKTVANWDTAPLPSLPCLLALKHLLLPSSQEAGPLKLPCMSMAQAWKVFKAFLAYQSSDGSLLEDNWLQWHRVHPHPRPPFWLISFYSSLFC